jgi:sec-independent protein translocase protein TatA
MYGLSGEHLLVILVILLIFGPRRLPDLGHSIGRTLKNFKDGMSGMNQPSAPESSPLLEAKEAKAAMAEPQPAEEKQKA